MDKKPIGAAALLLACFAILGTGLVALTKEATAGRIAEQQLRALLSGLNEIVPSARYDNDLAMDITTAQDKILLGGDAPRTIYRARKEGKPVAVVISTAAPDSYSGTEIKMLVGINLDGSLAGVRVVSHKETPGLGDGIVVDRSDWILSFNGKGLHTHTEDEWAVKKDGGHFDQFTGATITPRAVVQAVHKALKYFDKHQDKIFESSSADPADVDAGAHDDQ